MEDHNPFWLPHLTSEIVHDARGYELCAYAVALEGWRRGLTLEWYTEDSEKFRNIKTWDVDSPGKLFSLSSQDKTHYFFRTRGDKVTNEAVEIGTDIGRMKSILSTHGISVPEGKRFRSDVHQDEIIRYVSSTIGYPLFLKPIDGGFGSGCVMNIQNDEGLIKAVKYVRQELHYTDVFVERYIPGKEYRMYVVGDQVVGALHRMPANVTGDGIHSIKQLIDKKNEERKRNPHLCKCLIVIDQEIIDYLQSTDKTLESIPEKGERVFLREQSNETLGGDPIDVMDELSNEIKTTAIKTIAAIPGLAHGVVDLIVDDSQLTPIVLEVNPSAPIGSFLFPIKGRARDIPRAIIDYYFPETKEVVTEKAKIYFDFQSVLEPLWDKSAIFAKVSPAPVGKIYAKKYTVSGLVQDINYHRGLRKQAFDRGLSGFVNKLDNGDIEIVVVGTNKDDVDDFREAILEDPERSEVWKIEQEDWDQPVKVGFEVSIGTYHSKLKSVEIELNKVKKEVKTLEKERKRAKRQFIKYQRSRSWLVTYPFRKAADLFKFFLR